MVTGRVNMMSKGLMNKFNKISTAATMIAVKKPLTYIPGRMLAKTTTAMALSTISAKVFTEFEVSILCKIKKTAKVKQDFSSL